MATEILATGTASANSADVVVASGTQLTVCLKDASGPWISSGARVEIQLKADTGEYFTVGSLDYAQPATVITASGTYRFARLDGSSCGVFSA